jgi:hypothetical protein
VVGNLALCVSCSALLLGDTSGYWVMTGMSVAWFLVAIHAVLTIVRYSVFFFCGAWLSVIRCVTSCFGRFASCCCAAVVGVKESVEWWRKASEKRVKVLESVTGRQTDPLHQPFLFGHPERSMSVVGELLLTQQSSDHDRKKSDGDEGDDIPVGSVLPEVDLLLRRAPPPRFPQLPPSAVRTRIVSDVSSFDASDALSGRQSSRAFDRTNTPVRRNTSVVSDVLQSSPNAARPHGPSEVTLSEIDPCNLHSCASGRCLSMWLVCRDAMSCLRRCYFAEETPPEARYVKPVPLMVQHVCALWIRLLSCRSHGVYVILAGRLSQRYYPNPHDRAAELEFVLPPINEGDYDHPHSPSVLVTVTHSVTRCWRRWYAVDRLARHVLRFVHAFLVFCSRKPRKPQSPVDPEHKPAGTGQNESCTDLTHSSSSGGDAHSIRAKTRPRMLPLEQRNIAYHCFRVFHLSLGSFVAAVIFGAFGSLMTTGYSEYVAVGILGEFVVWLMMVCVGAGSAEV